MSCAFQESFFGFKQWFVENFVTPLDLKSRGIYREVHFCDKGWIKGLLFGGHLWGCIHPPLFCQGVLYITLNLLLNAAGSNAFHILKVKMNHKFNVKCKSFHKLLICMTNRLVTSRTTLQLAL